MFTLNLYLVHIKNHMLYYFGINIENIFKLNNQYLYTNLNSYKYIKRK